MYFPTAKTKHFHKLTKRQKYNAIGRRNLKFCFYWQNESPILQFNEVSSQEVNCVDDDMQMTYIQACVILHHPQTNKKKSIRSPSFAPLNVRKLLRWALDSQSKTIGQ